MVSLVPFEYVGARVAVVVVLMDTANNYNSSL